jgi:hypothetical protein
MRYLFFQYEDLQFLPKGFQLLRAQWPLKQVEWTPCCQPRYFRLQYLDQNGGPVETLRPHTWPGGTCTSLGIQKSAHGTSHYSMALYSILRKHPLKICTREYNSTICQNHREAAAPDAVNLLVMQLSCTGATISIVRPEDLSRFGAVDGFRGRYMRCSFRHPGRCITHLMYNLI